MFPFQQAHSKSDLLPFTYLPRSHVIGLCVMLSIMITVALRMACVDSLLPGSTEKPVDSPCVSIFNCLLLMTDLSMGFFVFVFVSFFFFCQDKITTGYHFMSQYLFFKKRRNPKEAISLKAILCNRNLQCNVECFQIPPRKC